MKQVDYIVVGLGIAAIAFTEQLRKANKSFVVYSSTNNDATAASGGVLNPTVLKRFTAAWNTVAFSEYAIPFYKQLGKRLQTQVIDPVTIVRILNSIEEQNNWMVASDKKIVSRFLSSEILSNNNPSVKSNYGLGEVKEGHQIYPLVLINKVKENLKNETILVIENFEYDALDIREDTVVYKDIVAARIVFAEGAGVIKNPYFPCSFHPEPKPVFVPNKGEYIIIKAPELKTNKILKGPVMLIPLGNDLYKVGASYGRNETDAVITKEACEDISVKLQTMISCNFEVVDQVTGVRPTVKDRRPLLGKLPKNKIVYFFNGLGTRGLTMAPLLSHHLFEYIEHNTTLPVEIDLQRFLK